MKMPSMPSDQEMIWKSYMKKLEAKCHKFLNIMKIVVHINGRADKKHLKLLYNFLMWSKMDSGAVMYDSTIAWKKQIFES